MGDMDEYDETPVVQVEYDEVPVIQVDDHDTIPMGIPIRATTSTDWPPAPPPPRELDEEDELIELANDLDLAAGTAPGTKPVTRNAGIYAVVRRPTTSNESS